MLKCLLPVAASILICAQAHAEESARAWTHESDQMIQVDSSDAGHDPDFKSIVRIITARSESHPTVQLSCQVTNNGYEALNVSVQLDPENTYQDDPDRSPKFHHLSGTLSINGDKQTDRYAFHAKSTKLIPLKREIASRIYNSVIRGDKVSLKVQGQTRDLALPAKNDVFVAFAKFCPVTNGGDFDMSIFDTTEAKQISTSLRR